MNMRCLFGNDVMTAKVSDHYPIIHHGVLFWNVMMQGKKRKVKDRESYNNGFGLDESDQNYTQRLVKIANVIAEIVHDTPTIQAISLCEGPIQASHIKMLIDAFHKYPHMRRFFKERDFFKPNLSKYPNWGLLMLVDASYRVVPMPIAASIHPIIFNKLANRLQCWKLSKNNKSTYICLAHFPFGGDEFVIEKSDLSNYGRSYIKLINELILKYTNESFILCADFNFNPYLLESFKNRLLDNIPSQNSILYPNKTVTVDGILLSKKAKQKHQYTLRDVNLFSNIKHEIGLFKSCYHHSLESLRHLDGHIQHEYDKRFGLTL